MYGEMDCFACQTAHKYFVKRNDIEYKFYDIKDETNRDNLHQLYPVFANPKKPIDTATPVIQECKVDSNGNIKDCSIRHGFNEEWYE